MAREQLPSVVGCMDGYPAVYRRAAALLSAQQDSTLRLAWDRDLIFAGGDSRSSLAQTITTESGLSLMVR